MFCMNKNYNEIDRVHYESVGNWQIKRAKFLSNCWKMCPNCGAILKIDANGCDNCLFQFDRTCRGIRRSNEE